MYKYCESHQLPLLPAIVVRDDESPNERYKKWPAERDDVFAYDWSQVPVPSEDDFVLQDDDQDLRGLRGRFVCGLRDRRPLPGLRGKGSR